MGKMKINKEHLCFDMKIVEIVEYSFWFQLKLRKSASGDTFPVMLDNNDSLWAVFCGAFVLCVT